MRSFPRLAVAATPTIWDEESIHTGIGLRPRWLLNGLRPPTRQLPDREVLGTSLATTLHVPRHQGPVVFGSTWTA